MAKRSNRSARPKRVNYDRIPETGRDGKRTNLYAIMDDLIANHHPHLADARVVMLWRRGWKANTDGRLTLGMCEKASDFDRELKDYDIAIVLNAEAWDRLAHHRRVALVDHELTHAAVSEDDGGEPKLDERGRVVYRIRKRDLGEFRCVVERHGCYLADIEDFVRAAAKSAGPSPLDAGGSGKDEEDGDDGRSSSGGGVMVWYWKRPNGKCRHCHIRKACRPKSLCSTCGADQAIRALYPSTSKFARRGIRDFNGRVRPPEPTMALPGTPEKVAALQERARLGLALWASGDAGWEEAGRKVAEAMANNDGVRDGRQF